MDSRRRAPGRPARAGAAASAWWAASTLRAVASLPEERGRIALAIFRLGPSVSDPVLSIQDLGYARLYATPKEEEGIAAAIGPQEQARYELEQKSFQEAIDHGVRTPTYPWTPTPLSSGSSGGRSIGDI